MSERHEHNAVDGRRIAVRTLKRMLDHAVVVCGISRFKNGRLITVRKLHLAADADDEFFAFMGRDHRLGIRCELDTERIHMTVGLAHG